MRQRGHDEAELLSPSRAAQPHLDRNESRGTDYAVLVGRTVADVERELILATLRHCHGNRTHAANILGISIRTLRNKLHEYAESGIAVPPPGSDGSEMRFA